MSIKYFSKSKLINSKMWKKPITFKYLLLALLLLSIFVLYLVNSVSSIYFPSQIRIFNKPRVNISGALAKGKRVFEVMTSTSKSFKIIQVEIDPLDVKKGKTQIVTVRIEDTENNPITEENMVEAIVYQDNISTQFSFSLKKTDDSDIPNISIWQGSWVSEDTHDLKYTMTITAKSADNSHLIDLSFR